MSPPGPPVCQVSSSTLLTERLRNREWWRWEVVCRKSSHVSPLYRECASVSERKKTKSGLAAHKSMHLLSNISSSDASVKTKRRWGLVDHMLDRTLFEGSTGLNFHNDVFSLKSTSVWEDFRKKQNAFEMTYRLARSSRLTFFVPIGWSDRFGACFFSLAAVPSQVLQTGYRYYHLRFGLHKTRQLCSLRKAT